MIPTLFLLVLVSLSALVRSSPVPGTLAPRAGPSGSLTYPAGGTTITNVNSLGYIYVQYEGVSTTGSNGGAVYTVDIDIELYSGGVQQGETVILGLRAETTGTTIVGYVSPTFSTCGTYQVVITEHQMYEGELISFQAAAPTIEIVEC